MKNKNCNHDWVYKNNFNKFVFPPIKIRICKKCNKLEQVREEFKNGNNIEQSTFKNQSVK